MSDAHHLTDAQLDALIGVQHDALVRCCARLIEAKRLIEDARLLAGPVFGAPHGSPEQAWRERAVAWLHPAEPPE